jgi:hypothetical protein
MEIEQERNLCWIGSSDSGDYEQCRPLGYNMVYFREMWMLMKKTSPPSSG